MRQKLILADLLKGNKEFGEIAKEVIFDVDRRGPVVC